MASTRSLLRCPLVCSAAVVCEVTSLLLALLRAQGPISVLHVGASQNLPLLNETRAGLIHGSLFITPGTRRRTNPFLQSTVNATTPSQRNDASNGGVASVIPVAPKAPDNGKESNQKRLVTQAGERTIQKGERPNLSSVAASLLHSLDKVRHSNPQHSPQGSTWSQRSLELHHHSAEAGTTWAGSKGMRAKSTGTAPVVYSASQTGSDGASLASTKQTGWKPSFSTTSSNLPTFAAALPPKRRAGPTDIDALISLLSSLQAKVYEQGEPAKEQRSKDDLTLQGNFQNTEAEVATTAKADGQGPARRVSLSTQNNISTVTSFPVQIEGSPMWAAMHGRQVAAEKFPGSSSTYVSPQKTLQTTSNETVIPHMTMTTSALRNSPAPLLSAANLGGSLTHQREQQQHLQHQEFNFQQESPQQQQHVPMVQRYMVQNDTVTTVNQRSPMAQTPSLEGLATAWYPYAVEQAWVPRSQAPSASFVADGTDQEQAERASVQRQAGPPEQWNTPQTTSPADDEGETHLTAAEFQSQLEKMGYKEARELPATKGIKMMATGIALGMAGALPPGAVAGLLGLGAFRYVLSKRAQAKAAAAYSGSYM